MGLGRMLDVVLDQRRHLRDAELFRDYLCRDAARL